MAHTKDNRWTKRILAWILKEERRSRGRPWEDDAMLNVWRDWRETCLAPRKTENSKNTWRRPMSRSRQEMADDENDNEPTNLRLHPLPYPGPLVATSLWYLSVTKIVLSSPFLLSNNSCWDEFVYYQLKAPHCLFSKRFLVIFTSGMQILSSTR